MALRPIFITFILCIITTVISAEDLTITCLYEPNKEFHDSIIDKFLTCNLKSNLTATGSVKEVTGEPGTTKPTDVKVFEVTGVMIQRIPKGLKSVFAGLVGIKITDTEFNYLSKDDLTEYSALEYLEISNSKLSLLLADTFSGTTALKLINLSGNMIGFIGMGAFEGLNNLNYLNLDVLCLLGDANAVADTAAKIPDLKTAVTTKCSSEIRMNLALTEVLKNYLQALESSQNCDIDDPEIDCPEDCEEEVAEWKGKYDDEAKLHQTCKGNITDLNKEITDLNKSIQELESQPCESGNGTCSYKTLSSTYTCVAQKIFVKTTAEQTVSWTGTHASGKNNAAVVSMVIQGQTVEILPLNIGTVFTNLKSLAVKSSGLTKIKAGDFKTLTKLETLEITGNKITTIDATAFAGLTALVEIDFSSNNIAAVPAKLFDTLSALKIINLNDNKFTQVRYDVINSANSIAEVYLKNNAIVPLDRTFIWRLQKANKIDLSETGCEHSFDRAATPVVTFMTFYTNVVLDC